MCNKFIFTFEHYVWNVLYIIKMSPIAFMCYDTITIGCASTSEKFELIIACFSGNSKSTKLFKTTYVFLRLSDLTVYFSDNIIVLIITLPLIYKNELTLYHLIPKPVCILINCVYIKSSYNFLAISKTK